MKYDRFVHQPISVDQLYKAVCGPPAISRKSLRNRISVNCFKARAVQIRDNSAQTLQRAIRV